MEVVEPRWTRKDARAYVRSQKWVYAKSMPKNPHEYVLLERSTDPERHMAFKAFIRESGREERFKRTAWVWSYLDDLDGYTYWVPASDPAPDGHVWNVINRRPTSLM